MNNQQAQDKFICLSLSVSFSERAGQGKDKVKN
jgi:hypothetical protein